MGQRRFGVRWRLLLAFLGISAFSVLAAAAAMYAFFEVDQSLDRIVQQRVPAAIGAQNFSRQAERIIAAAPSLLAASNPEELEQQSEEIQSEFDRLRELLAEFKARDVDPSLIETIENLVDWLGLNLVSVDTFLFSGLVLNEQKRELLRQLASSRIATQRLLAPGILVMESNLAQLRGMIEEAEPSLEQRSTRMAELTKQLISVVPLQRAKSESSAVNDILVKAASAESIEALQVLLFPLRRSLETFKASASEIDPPLRSRLLAQVEAYQDFLEGPKSIIGIRERELRQLAIVTRQITENVEISRRLSEAVDHLVEGASQDIASANREAISAQRISTLVMFAVVALGLVCSVLIVWLYVGRNLIARLSALNNSMMAIAGGNLETTIPIGGGDEIGDMAKALSVFRDTAIEVRETNLREIREARRRLTDAIESISEGFVLYDSDDRLVIHNRPYRDLLYPGLEETVVPGAPFETIVRRAAELGDPEEAEGRVEDWVAERIAGHLDPGEPQVQQRWDGRWVRVSERKTEGGGTVAVYTDITEVKRAEQAVVESEQFLATLVDNIPAAVFFRDLDSRYIRVNRMYEEMFQVTDESVRGKTLHDVFPGDQADDYTAYDRDAIEQRRVLKREETHVLQGAEHIFDALKFPILDTSGQVIAVGGVDYDITDLKRAEEAAAEAEARLIGAIENISEGFVLYDPDGRLVLCNGTYKDFYNYTDAEVAPGVHFEDLVRLDIEKGTVKSDGDEDHVRARVAERGSAQDSFDLGLSDGRWLNISDRKTAAGGYVSTQSDVTELRRAEQALRESEQRLSDAIESISEGFSLYDADDRLVVCNGRYREIMYPPGTEDFVRPGMPFETIVRSAAERGLIRGAGDGIEAWIAKRLVQHNNPSGPIEVHREGGRWVQISERKTEGGNTVAVYTDVTELKQAEEAAAEAEGRLTDAIESFSAGLVLYDSENRLVLCNRGFKELWGYSDSDAAPGATWDDLIRLDAERGTVIDEESHKHASERDLREWRKRRRGTIDVRFRDGRWVTIRDRTTATGGTVSIQTDITERKRAETELAEKEAQLRLALDNMPGGMMLGDRDFNYVLFNRQYSELHEFPDGLLKVGGSIFDEARFQAERGDYGPGNKEELIEQVVATLRRGEAVSIERAIAGSGRTLQIYVAPTPEGGYINICTDISELKHREKELAEKSAFLQLNQAITRAANETTSVEAAMQIALDRVCAHTGWPVGHAYMLDESGGDLAPSGIWHLDDAQKFETFRSVTEATRFASGVGLPGRVLASGEPAWIFDVTKDPNFPRAELATEIGVKGAFAFPVLVGPRVAAVLEFFAAEAVEAYPPLLEVMAQIGTQLGRAIERKRAEELLLAAKELAEGATKTKSQFLANMSHELRTPLNVILGVSEIMQEEAEEQGLEDFLESLDHVSREGKHLLHLIEEILDLSKIEAGKLEFRLEDFDVAALMRDAAVAVQPLADKNSNRLVVNCPEDIGAMHADPLRVRQVVLNLLSNACKFTEGGEVTLELGRERTDGTDWLEVTVSDTGIGMTPDQTEKLFEEFTQADGSMTRKYGGTGLGLAISRRLCRMMGGEVSLTSELGEGTTFTARLPLAVTLPAEASEVESNAASAHNLLVS